MMKQYHKIQSVFKRDEKTHKFITGKYSLPEFEYLKDNKWIFTEKVDGTNIRVGWNHGEFLSKPSVEINGKTNNAQLHIDLIKELQALFPIEKFMTLYPETSMTLYGEGYGAGIQKGGKYSQKKTFVLFDIFIDGYWLSRENVKDIADKLEVRVVPIIGWGTLDALISYCEGGFNSKWGDFIAEGIVARPEVELFSRNGHRIITKCKHTDF